MLSSREKKLLTVYVDGECTPREAQLVGRLLRRSEEARALLSRLEGDSQTLRSMPALTIPIDLTEPVQAAAAALPPAPAPTLPFAPAPRDAFPVWRGVAAAAAVLFLVGLASFWMNTGDAPTPKVAKSGGPKKPDGTSSEGHLARGPKDGEGGPAPKHQPPQRQPVDPEWPSEGGPEVVNPEDDDPPAKPNTTVITSGVLDALPPLERVTLALPRIHQAHQLDKAEAASKLLDQLTAGKGFRLELLCRDGTRGLERLRAALAAKKVTVTIDPVAQARMKKSLVRSDYAVFVENVTPKELLELLRDAAVADRQAAAKKPAEQRFDGPLVVKPLGLSDRKELATLLGLDPVRSRPEPAKRPSKVDITKPLSELTDKQVGDALHGLAAPRPGARPPLGAMVVPLSGPRVRSSAELSNFLKARTPAQPGTVQALIVLRQV